MAKKESEPKKVLEREYIIPLRREWLKVPEYKRANKAVKSIKEFLVRHMKIYDRDLRKIKIDILLNNELRFRGMRKPPAKIKVKAVKYDNEIVRVELAEIPPVIKYKLEREKRQKERTEEKKKKEEKPAEKTSESKRTGLASEKEELKKKIEEEKKAEEKEVKEEEAEKDKEEKKESTVEAGLKVAKEEARKQKHVATSKKQPKIHRMALQK